MLRNAGGGFLLLVAVTGCDSGRPFDKPRTRMAEAPAAPAAAPRFGGAR